MAPSAMAAGAPASTPAPAPAPRPGPPLEPYRVLFPLGWLFAIAGAVVWPLEASGLIPYPGTLHGPLMIQGFEQCFIMGLLLTAIRMFTRGERASPWEIGVGAGAMVAFGALAGAGQEVMAQLAYLVGVALLLYAVIMRLGRRAAQPPPEITLVLFGLGLGACGVAALVAAELGLPIAPYPRFGLRLVSFGMVLSLVLGVGGVLVPLFSGNLDPKAASSPAPADAMRALLYAALGGVIGLSFVADALGLGWAVPAAWLRALAATTVVLAGWRHYRLPARRDRFGFSLWVAGWLVVGGLWLTALLPGRPMLGFHTLFMGGFGLLTMSIASRVVVVHGGHPAGAENVLLAPATLAALGLALGCRWAAELTAAGASGWLASSGTLWTLSWLLWGWRALPRMRARAAAAAP